MQPGALVEELPVPYRLLGIPIDDISLLNRSLEGHLAKVRTFFQFGSDVRMLVP